MCDPGTAGSLAPLPEWRLAALFAAAVAAAFPPPMPKADAKGKWNDLELLTEGLVLVTEVVMVLVRDGPPPIPELALAGT